MDANFLKILQRLAEEGVEFVVVGGIAANFHGCALSTFDCDVVVDLGSENLSRLAKALSGFSPMFRHKEPPQSFDEATAARGGWENIYLETSAGVLDCLGDIKGLGDFAECKSRSLEADFGDFSIRFLTREALIEAKKAMGRPKDLLTVAQLEISGELEGE
ncbi:MAG: hypothetical protein N2A42_08450 [Luteolibacter sp.]